jgi:hypothetical protein
MSAVDDTASEPFRLTSDPIRPRGQFQQQPNPTFLVPKDIPSPPGVQTKRCCTCKCQVPIDQFNKNRTTRDGLEKRCPECIKTARRNDLERIQADPMAREARNARKRDYLEQNPEKAKEWSRRATRKRSKDYNRNSHIKSLYGITIEEYDGIFRLQGGVCAICGLPETRKNRHRGVCRLHIDHAHTADGRVRGLLCSRCNSAIGLARDDTEILRKMIEYLERHKSE